MTQTSQPVPASEQREAFEKAAIANGWSLGDHEMQQLWAGWELCALSQQAAAEPVTTQAPAQQEALRMLSYELDGVIIDTEQGRGFDDVCLNTVKRVRDALKGQPQEPAATVQPVAQTEREAETSKKALDAILWMYRRLKPTTGELQFIEDAIRALSHQPAQADGQKGSAA